MINDQLGLEWIGSNGRIGLSRSGGEWLGEAGSGRIDLEPRNDWQDWVGLEWLGEVRRGRIGPDRMGMGRTRWECVGRIESERRAQDWRGTVWTGMVGIG